VWANLDPVEMLPTPRVRRGSRLRRIGRLLLVMRNVAVFVPVGITWLAIQQATDEFVGYANARVGTDVNFLTFWASGGDADHGIDKIWRIGSIAFADALIISFIVAATLVAGSLEARSIATQRKEHDIIERERLTIALALGEALQGNRTADPESVTEALAFAMNNLSEASRDLNTAASRIETVTSGMDALTPSVVTLSQNVEGLSQQLASGVTASVTALVASVTSLGHTLDGDMQTFLSNVLAGVDAINERFTQTIVAAEFGTKQLKDDLDAMHSRLAQLTGRS